MNRNGAKRKSDENQFFCQIYATFWEKKKCTFCDSQTYFFIPEGFWRFFLTGVWTQIFLKHIECCNFQIITEMYIKVYISGMEMSQRIHFWYQIVLKIMFFWENGKKPLFLVKNFCDKLTETALS